MGCYTNNLFFTVIYGYKKQVQDAEGVSSPVLD